MRRQDAEDAIRRLAAGDLEAVIFESGGFYVQFAREGDGRLLVEAVGDDYLDERLTPDQNRQLYDFGFRPPGGRGPGNHAMTMDADAGAAARLASETLASVYGVEETSVTITEV